MNWSRESLNQAIKMMAALLFAGFSAGAAAQSFTGKGKAGCSDKSCWYQAVQDATAHCKASGCKNCSESKNAGDQCTNNNGYTCTSTCKDAPGAAKGPAGPTDCAGTVDAIMKEPLAKCLEIAARDKRRACALPIVQKGQQSTFGSQNCAKESTQFISAWLDQEHAKYPKDKPSFAK